MHIKQVIISGFRSFRNQSEIEPFSKGHNAVVGRNGSGKSNFFDAIQFVLLAPKFYNLRQDERQHLLHEGAGANVMSAFVEVIFDNSDGRIAQDGDEVVLRRTIGLKKDEFFLNRKRVTKQEVSSLLESAGFSKSNPYYIVQQGKVSNLCLMKDEERLNLLKEVGGTKVYEERRQESLNIMAETNSQREKIQEMIDYIEERLGELEEEKDELRQYQSLDRERRALEYTLYNKELSSAREELERIERTRVTGTDETNELHNMVRETQDRIAQTEHQLQISQVELRKLNSEKEKVEGERMELIQNRAKLELEVKELTEKFQNDQTSQAELKEELKTLEGKIIDAEKELNEQITPLFEQAKGSVDETTLEVNNLSREREELYSKKSRGSQFSTVKERDTFLKKEIKSLKANIELNQKGISQCQQELEATQSQIDRDRQQIVHWESEIINMQAKMQEATALYQEKQLLRNEMHEDRKTRWRELEHLRDQLDELKQQKETADRNLRSMMPRHISQGLEAVEKIVAKENIQGYYGPVIENFTLSDPKFQTPVEVAAGQSLFNVIVENDEIASQLMRKLEKHKLGRLTFMPLNKIRVKKLNYPDSPEVVPLISCALKFDPKVEVAMRQIFGRKLIARNQEVAAHFANLADMDAITMDGDEINRKGSIQGGYYDERSNRLGMVEAIRQADAELQPKQDSYDNMDRKVREVDQEITSLLGDIQKLEAKKQNLTHLTSEKTKDAQLLSEKVEKTVELVERQRNRLLPQLESDMLADQQKCASLEAELGTPLQSTLSAEEQHRLIELQDLLSSANDRLATQTRKLDDASSSKQRITALLKNNLRKRLKEVQSALNPAGKGGKLVEREGKLRQSQAELDSSTRALEENKVLCDDVNKKLKELKSIVKNSKTLLEDLKAQDLSNQEKVMETTKSAEKLLNKRAMLLQKREDNTKKIQELGSLPTAEIEAHKDKSIKDLIKKLHQCNEKLKKYSHVNKKALDQYVNFSEHRTVLIERRDEVTKGAEAIENLIKHLDQQKDEAILRTFKGVSHHFSEVFKELVPNGFGEMVIKTAADKASDEEGAEERKENTTVMDVTSINEFVGVQVRVSFTGSGEHFLMQQLSGGQKALVALAIIFSIQRCDPAPFYLLDELDQALDSSYRAQVAALIQRQAHDPDNPAQFVTSTFRPEIVSVADKCYGISLQNKVSNINPLEKEHALDFVRDLMNEEEKIGQVTTQAQKGKTGEGAEDEVAGKGSKAPAAKKRKAPK